MSIFTQDAQRTFRESFEPELLRAEGAEGVITMALEKGLERLFKDAIPGSRGSEA